MYEIQGMKTIFHIGTSNIKVKVSEEGKMKWLLANVLGNKI